MIFFNIPQARNQLTGTMKVYTLRSSFRTTGKTLAVKGSFFKHTPIYDVNVERIKDIHTPEDLLPFLDYSGFDNVFEWFEAASSTARTLYLVTKWEDI